MLYPFFLPDPCWVALTWSLVIDPCSVFQKHHRDGVGYRASHQVREEVKKKKPVSLTPTPHPVPLRGFFFCQKMPIK